ncbi:Asparagine synthetase [glutamine-hydrolyzing] 3, partial [Sarracenia purpurea var. burkii]
VVYFVCSVVVPWRLELLDSFLKSPLLLAYLAAAFAKKLSRLSLSVPLSGALVNGEIYNHKQLRQELKSHQFRTGSDCEVIAHLYEEYGEDFVDMLDGMFSFVLLDTRDKSFIAAWDAIGITPFYMGWGLDAPPFKCLRLSFLDNEF